MYKILFFTYFLTALVLTANAQKPDSAVTKNKADTTAPKKYVPPIITGKVYHPDSTHLPKKALFRSGVIPGWGQLYNHRWWKVPIIYGGLALLGDVIVYNQNNYSIFLKEAELREKGILTGRNPALSTVQDADVITYTDIFRRDRDLGILGFIGGWGIQMIDAYIDAKFIQRFTMDNDLGLKIKPGIFNQPAFGNSSFFAVKPGLSLTLTFK